MDSEPKSFSSSRQTENGAAADVSFGDAIRFWTKLGFISFGGPAGQIGIMQSELVDRRGWIGQQDFLRGLNFAMLLPGPEAQQLAAYLGWRLHGIRGALYAGISFIVPGTLVILALAWLAAAQGDQPFVAAAFAGIKPVVVAIVLHALWRIGSRTLHSAAAYGLAIAAFLALYVFSVPFPAVVIAAGVFGLLFPSAVQAPSGHGADAATSNGAPAAGSAAKSQQVWRFIRITAIFIALWLGPVIVALTALGTDPWGGIVQLFTTAAFVTFGGAYAVLPYIAEAAVETHGWLSPSQMIDGLALAESTPGPLILVTVYVGFFAGWGAVGALTPLVSGLVGGLLTAYVTFLPCFWFILAAAPFVDRIQDNPKALGALSAITAAIVGVILNLAVFFGEAVFLPSGLSDLAAINWLAIVGACVAFAALARFKMSVPLLIAAGAVVGLLYLILV
ncbi:MAG: chromate efflux transporter [Alphaproteobacteria bacterium]|nr:chromate efflux transporter [Alphaproteobacteria bacterium]